ncbi:MAG: hypothetical protein AB1898_33255, partial [Acidobacteriota bacterium]
NIFVHDRLTRETRCVSENVRDVVVMTRGLNRYPSISADGRFVAFMGLGSGLVAGDTNDTYDVFVRGPELTLEADPPVVGSDQPLTLTEYSGVPGNNASLWVVAVNGSRTLFLVASGSFGDTGAFVVSGLVPPGLSGVSITFRGYALGRAGLQVRSNDVTVSFQ